MFKAVIFDMDGTILDTLEDLKDSLNYSLSKYGFDERSLDEVRSYVGNGLHKTVERAVADNATEEDVEKIFECMVPYYKEHCRIKTKPYDGIVDVIRKIKTMGIATAVISNKNNAAVGQLCEEMFKDCFDYYMGETEGIKLKPDREMVDITLSKLGVSNNEALYIGDSEVDILTASNSMMKCLAVTWGFRDKEMLIENGATDFVDKPEQIIEYLQ